MYRHRWVHAGIVLFLLALLITMLQSLSAAQPARPTGWQVVGQIGGPTSAVAAQGGYAYIGVGLRLVVLDVTNPVTPTEVGATTPFPYFVEDIAVSGTLAYVAAGGAGLRVVDISDPANPTELGAWDSPGYAEGIAVSGTTVYLADGPYGLRVVDVSNPASPTPLGSAYDMNYAFDVVAAGDYIYVAAAGAGLLTADVSDPGQPVAVGTLDTPGYTYGVAVSGTVAYIADGWEGVRLVNLSNPGTPTEVGAYRTPGWAFDVTVSGNRAYVADAFGGLRVLDVSDPAQPSELGGCGVTGGHAGSVAVAGSTAYVADRNSGLQVVSVSDPAHPVQVGSYTPLVYARGVTVKGSYAYLAAAYQGLVVIDISEPTHPAGAGSHAIQSYTTGVVIQGDYVYVLSWHLHVLDISDPAHPTEVGFLEEGGGRDIAVAGDFAYVPNEWGLKVVSVSDLAHPAQVGFVRLWEYVGANDAAVGVDVSGSLAYVARSNAGLVIVDVSNPLSPTLVGAYDSGVSFSQDVVVAENVAYVADTSGLRTVDVSIPAYPTGMGFCGTPGEAYALVLSGTVAYVADGSRGVSIVDVSNPFSPTLSSSFDTLGYAHRVALAGNRIYVADGPNGLLILEPASGRSTIKPRADPAQDRSLPAQQASLEQTALRRTPVPLSDWPTRPAMPVMPPASPLRPRSPQPQIPVRAAAAAGTCTVTSTADSGVGTLRGCLENAASGDTIAFDPAVLPPADPVTISLFSPLPWLDQGEVTIDASDAGVILDGSGTPPGTTGVVIASDGNRIHGLQILRFPADGVLVFDGAKDNLIGGNRLAGSGPLGQGNLISGNGGNGISIYNSGTMSNTVAGNFVGTDLSGTTIVGNQVGVAIAYGASYNTVGGSTEGRRNVIAGNENDVVIWDPGSEHNVVTGNMIGTDPSGSFALRTEPPPGCCTRGVLIEQGAQRNTIGPGNVINGSYWGIQLFGEDVDENIIIGNLVGTNVSGTSAIGSFSNGILISEGPQCNRIGGAAPGERNIISGNGGNGISINGAQTISNTVIGNYVGTDAGGTAALGNMGPGGGIQVWSPRNMIGGYLPGEGNVVSSNGSNGISLIGSQAYGNRIIGNYTGTDVSGTADLGNRGYGIGIEAGAFSNLVQGNLSSGNNRAGVGISDPGSNYNVVIGNRLGTDASGTQALPNDECGLFVSSSFNRIGGTGSGEGNLISGNAAGVCFYDPGAVGNLLLGNLVGSDLSGGQAVPNSSGVVVGTGASHTMVGGATAAERNVISGNRASGVSLGSSYSFIVGNHIGTDLSGGAALGNAWVGVNVNDTEHAIIQGNLIAYNMSHGLWVYARSFNTIRRNSIHSNAERGIVVTDGGNQMLPSPVILTVTETTVSGTACPGCTVEVFSDDEDEGRIYEGTATADAAGVFVFDKGGLLFGPYLTATVTDSQGNTSEFSAPVARPVKVYLPLVLKSR